MKPRSILIPALCSGLLFTSSCDKKASEASDGAEIPEESSVAAEVAKDGNEVVAKIAPAGSVADRVANLGFVQYLPKDTQAVIASYKGADMVKRIRQSELGKFIEGIAKDQGTDLEEMSEGMSQDPQAGMAVAAFSEEFFMAVGPGAGEQSKNLLKASAALVYIQMKAGVQQVETELSGGAGDEMTQGMIQDQITAFLRDPEAGVDVIEKAKMPPVLIGFKVSDEEMRNQMVGMIEEGVGQALQNPEAPFEAASVEQGGVTFKGFKLSGQKLVASVGPDQRAAMAEQVGNEADVERILKSLEKKDLVVMSAVKDDYILFSLSASTEEVKLAAGPGDSVATAADFDFMDNYAGKDIRLLTFGDQKLLTDILSQNAAGTNAYLRGLSDGLKESKFFGDTTDIQVLLKHSMELIGKYYGKFEAQGGGLVGFLEEGFKIESYGGHNYPTADLKTRHQFADLGSAEKVFFFADWVNDPEMADLSLEILDSLGEAGYLMAKQASGLEVNDNDFREFVNGFNMFDAKFADDLRNFWKSIRTDWAAGVGSEFALLVDLDGGMPKVPAVPAPIIEKGKVPRLTMVAPVENREKLGQSWEGMNASLTSLLKNISEQSGLEIPMQEPLSSEADGKTTWFSTVIPFQSNDFLPNITVSDNYFIASTSKTLATTLDARLEAKEIKREGAYLGMNFSALWTYGRDWLDLLEKDADQIFDTDVKKDDFMNNLPMAKKALDAMESIEHLSIHTREENGKTRSSLHFRVK